MKQFTGSGLTARLFDIIQNMTEGEQLKLLSDLGEKRIYSRIAYIMPVKYETREGSYCDYITDISYSGAFIMTSEDFSIGQEMTISLSFRGQKDLFKIECKVVRATSEGIGVEYTLVNQKQKASLKNFLESME
jgi:Tfp pilus assembly protein PilZ